MLGRLCVFYVAFGVICKLGCFRLLQTVSVVLVVGEFTFVSAMRRRVEVDLGSLLFIHWLRVVSKPCWVVQCFSRCFRLFQVLQTSRSSWFFKTVRKYVRLSHFVFGCLVCYRLFPSVRGCSR